MLPQRLVESLVGLFLILAMIGLTVLALKVSGLTNIFPTEGYSVTAAFDDIGGLKVRAPVKISGVQIGEVTQIILDQTKFKAIVKMRILDKFRDIPDDSSAGIYTAGLLGDNYIAISPMYNPTFLKDGSVIQMTQSAIVLEKLIGQFLYKLGGNETASDKSTDNSTKLDDSNNTNGLEIKNAQQ